MKCQACGAQSGKYVLCKACNYKKEQGIIVKCEKCRQWHEKDSACHETNVPTEVGEYLYEKKKTLLTASEHNFYTAIKESVPEGYRVFPQINLAAFIERTDDARFHNELFRNVDFLITDKEYAPRIAIEINDRTHLNGERRERDEKVTNILEEAGIPLLKFWTFYGVNQEYIKGKIAECLNAPAERKHHFDKKKKESGKEQGCYIATCVYGSYDCPQVWTLRRYRDNTLARSYFGRLFIKIYYSVSPEMVHLFGENLHFRRIWKTFLDRKVVWLNNNGYSDKPYKDMV